MRVQLLGYFFASVALSILSFLLSNILGRDWSTSQQLLVPYFRSTPYLNYSTDGVPTFVVCGRDGMMPLVKSMLLLMSKSMRLVFVTDLNGAVRVESWFGNELRRYRRELFVDVVVVSEDATEKFANQIGINAVDRWAVTKLMVPWLLPGANEVAVIDTDMVFMMDPAELWAEQEQGSKEWVYRTTNLGLSLNEPLGSGVLLQRCKRLRKQRVRDTVLRDVLHNGERRKNKKQKSTQQLLQSVMHRYPELFSELPPRWNRDRCANYHHVFEKKNRDVVGLLHRNCGGARKGGDKGASVFDFYSGLRWHWLSGSGDVPVVVNVWNETVPIGNSKNGKLKEDTG